jgi:hypothetical protein
MEINLRKRKNWKTVRAKQARIVVVAELFRRGYTYREIQSEVMHRLSLSTYSLDTVTKDIRALLGEWKEERLGDTEIYVQIELQRNQEQMKEAWLAWEKSKVDFKQKSTTKRGSVKAATEQQTEQLKINAVEQTEHDHITWGDPRYLAELRALADQRCKLLGLFVDKKEISGRGGKNLFEGLSDEELEGKVKQLMNLVDEK